MNEFEKEDFPKLLVVLALICITVFIMVMQGCDMKPLANGIGESIDNTFTTEKELAEIRREAFEAGKAGVSYKQASY